MNDTEFGVLHYVNSDGTDWEEILALKGEDGKDGKTVQVLSATQGESDIKPESVFAFSLAETTSDNESYTKTQSDVKYAKSVEVGNTSTIVVPDVNTLVKAINKVWLAGLDHMALDSTTKTLNLVTRAGVVVPFDISQIILNTNIEEFKNVLVTNILDGQSLVYSASKQKWINKSIDSSGMLVEAKAYTDDEIKKINNKGSIACDEKPTYYGGVITYKKGGVTKTTDNAGTWFYYLDAEGNATQTIFIEGTEFTIAMAGEINLDDYIAQTEKLAVYDENFVDKTKVPTTAYMEEFKSAIDEVLADKVNVADIEDTLTSDSTTKVLSAKQGKALKSAIDGLIDDTADSTVENKTYSAKKISEAIDGVNPSWNGTKAEYDALDKSTLKDGQTVNITDDTDDALIDDTTSATDKVYSSNKIATDYPFKLGIDANGNYGYYKVGADSVTPFKKTIKYFAISSDNMTANVAMHNAVVFIGRATMAPTLSISGTSKTAIIISNAANVYTSAFYIGDIAKGSSISIAGRGIIAYTD